MRSRNRPFRSTVLAGVRYIHCPIVQQAAAFHIGVLELASVSRAPELAVEASRQLRDRLEQAFLSLPDDRLLVLRAQPGQRPFRGEIRKQAHLFQRQYFSGYVDILE